MPKPRKKPLPAPIREAITVAERLARLRRQADCPQHAWDISLFPTGNGGMYRDACLACGLVRYRQPDVADGD